MTSKELLDGILEGKQNAYDYHRATVLPSIKRLLGPGTPREDVFDLFDEAMLVLIKKARHPDFELTAKLSTYFYGICQNILRNRQTKRNSQIERTYGEVDKFSKETVSPDDDFDAISKDVLVVKALMRLDESCRKLLQLYYLEELPRKDTARILNVTDTHVSHHSKKCLERLKEIILCSPDFDDVFGD